MDNDNRIEKLEQALRHCLSMMKHAAEGLDYFPQTQRFVRELVDQYSPLVAHVLAPADKANLAIMKTCRIHLQDDGFIVFPHGFDDNPGIVARAYAMVYLPEVEASLVKSGYIKQSESPAEIGGTLVIWQKNDDSTEAAQK